VVRIAFSRVEERPETRWRSSDAEVRAVVEFRSRPDGSKYPITPRKGTAGAVVAAAVLAGGMAAAGGAGVTDAVGSALDAGAQRAADARAEDASKSAKKGDAEQTWQRMALKEVEKQVKDHLRCAVQSYGQVQEYFQRNPCESLSQLLVTLEDTDGNVFAVSVSWVKMGSAADASGLKAVEDRYGSGDVTPFAAEAVNLAGFRFTGQHYKARQDGSPVVFAEADAVRGRPDPVLLDRVAGVAVLLPAV
jgi:hypothetical protein